MRAGALLYAWRGWLNFLLLRRHKQELLQRAVGRFANSRVHAAFTTWQVCSNMCIAWLNGGCGSRSKSEE